MEHAERRDVWGALRRLEEAMMQTRRHAAEIRRETDDLREEARRALEYLAVALGRAQQPPRRDSDAA